MKYADSHVLKKKFFYAAQPLENYGSAKECWENQILIGPQYWNWRFYKLHGTSSALATWE